MIAWYGANDASATFCPHRSPAGPADARRQRAHQLGIATIRWSQQVAQRHEQVAQMRAAPLAALAKRACRCASGRQYATNIPTKTN
jgi:hypothetical protein